MSDYEKDNLPVKRVEKPVAAGKLRKKSEISKLSDVFLADDVREVGRFVLRDTIIPAVKNLLFDIVNNGMNMALYGERGDANRKPRRNGEYVSYDKISRRDDRGYVDEPRVRTQFRYNDIEFDSRGEAEFVLDQMDAIIGQYGRVSIGDLYDLAQITGEYTDHKYGWTDITAAKIFRNRYGKYTITFPRAVPFNR